MRSIHESSAILRVSSKAKHENDPSDAGTELATLRLPHRYSDTQELSLHFRQWSHRLGARGRGLHGSSGVVADTVVAHGARGRVLAVVRRGTRALMRRRVVAIRRFRRARFSLLMPLDPADDLLHVRVLAVLDGALVAELRIEVEAHRFFVLGVEADLEDAPPLAVVDELDALELLVQIIDMGLVELDRFEILLFLGSGRVVAVGLKLK